MLLTAAVVAFASLPAQALSLRAPTSTWSGVGAPPSGAVLDLAAGPGGRLYAVGTFSTIGGVAAQHVARWDGATWTPIGDANDWVYAVAVAPNGDVYVGGRFTQIGGVAASRIARWDGTAWSAVGDGFDNPVEDLVFTASGTLYAGGGFRIVGDRSGYGLARWDGAAWSYVGGTGTNDGVYGLAVDGDTLYAGGVFSQLGGVAASRVARYDPENGVRPLGDGVTQVGGGPGVYALAVDAEGRVYAGGAFDAMGGAPVQNLARWHGAAWSSVGGVTGTTGGSTGVMALAFDRAGRLYVGGSFDQAGGLAARGVAVLAGDAWGTVGDGVRSGRVEALHVAPDLPHLYVGGGFSDMGGVAGLNFLARWDGAVATDAADAPDGGGVALSVPFPNPTADAATLQLTTDAARHVRVDLVDALGRTVAVLFDGRLAPGAPTTLRVERGGLAHGVYTVRAVTEGRVLGRRVALVR